MLSVVIDKLVEVLATQPDPVLSSNAMGAKRPATGAEIPAIAMAAIADDVKGTGIGRFRRAGDVIVQHIATVDVLATPDTFAGDLRSLRLAPLPLKKNPASLTQHLSEDDVQVRNVTVLASPITYRMAERPALKTEFRLDGVEARLVFGAAQTLGEKLEVRHWTVSWRDDILGDTYRGTLTLEIWANHINQVNEIVRKLQARLKTNPTLLRQKGFMSLQPASLDPAEHVLYAPPSGSPFPVWKQPLSYRFIFEYEAGGELSSGVPIKQIDVDLPQPPESFSVR